MNPKSIEIFVQKEFKNIPHDIPFTLAEMDYTDNVMGKFGFPFFPYRYNSDSYQKDFEEFEMQISHWLEKDKIEALFAINNKTKMKNPYQDWQDIPITYLNTYTTGFSSIQPNGFFFYTPTIIYHTVKSLAENLNGSGLTWWYFRIEDEFLKNNLETLFAPFNIYQLVLVSEFLELYKKNDKSLTENMSEITKAIDTLIITKYDEQTNYEQIENK